MNDVFHNFSGWLQLAFHQCRQQEFRGIIMLCWIWWKSHNEIVWNQRSLEATEVVESAKSVLNQWRNVHDKSFDYF